MRRATFADPRIDFAFLPPRNLTGIPPALQHPPLLKALEATRLSKLTRAEWDAYIASGMAIQDARGALSLARREGREEGRKAAIEELLGHLRRERRWP